MGQTKSIPVSSDGKLRVFHYSELAKATNNFSQRLGREEVYYGKLKDGRQISVEKLDQSTFRKFKTAQKLISRLVTHPNLVSIYGHTNLKKKFLRVHEHMSNGTLASLLYGAVAERRALPWLTRLDIAIDVANAIAYLHNEGIIHRDVKSSNILLDDNFCAKVRLDASALNARVSGDYVDNIVGTTSYIDPDYIHSFGVVLYELLSSKCASLPLQIQNKELDELLDPRLGFQFDDEIKQMIAPVVDLAIQCLQDPCELRPSQVLETLKNIKKNLQSQIRMFSYNELEDATDRFRRCEGIGVYGTVCYGKLQDGREVAVKLFHEREDRMQHFTKEVEVLSLLRHQHLVSLYGYCSKSDLDEELLLVCEYISNGTLATHLNKHSTRQLNLPWLTRLNIAVETASALAYLHDFGIIHRDVNASNILLEDNFSVKVADFGLSRLLPLSGSQGSSTYASHVSTDPKGAHGYMDPEYILYNKVSNKSDVYSFGVVLFELISSKPPAFMEGPQYVTLANFAMNKISSKALEELVDPSLQFDSDNKITETITAVAELAFQCVQCPKEVRPSMKQVLETLEGIKQTT